MSVVVVLAALAVVSSVPLLVASAVAGRGAATRVSRNLAAGLPVPTDLRRMVLAQSARERAVQPVVATLGRRARRMTPAGVVQAADRRLLLAGEPMTIEHFLAAKFALVTTAVGASLAWMVVAPSATSVLLVPAAAAMGVTLPDAVVARRARSRQERILLDLPDVLDQLTVCVEAGLGFDSALSRVASTNRGPMGAEIGRVLQDVNVGIPRREALDRLIERTDIAELRQFVHAVGQAESYGLPVASVLRAQAAEHREKRSSRAEERAQKMPVKIVFPLVFCILPAMFVVVIGPAAMRVFRTFL